MSGNKESIIDGFFQKNPRDSKGNISKELIEDTKRFAKGALLKGETEDNFSLRTTFVPVDENGICNTIIALCGMRRQKYQELLTSNTVFLTQENTYGDDEFINATFSSDFLLLRETEEQDYPVEIVSRINRADDRDFPTLLEKALEGDFNSSN